MAFEGFKRMFGGGKRGEISPTPPPPAAEQPDMSKFFSSTPAEGLVDDEEHRTPEEVGGQDTRENMTSNTDEEAGLETRAIAAGEVKVLDDEKWLRDTELLLDDMIGDGLQNLSQVDKADLASMLQNNMRDGVDMHLALLNLRDATIQRGRSRIIGTAHAEQTVAGIDRALDKLNQINVAIAEEQIRRVG